MVPANTSSRPGADIFKPHAAIAWSQLSHLSPASRISDIPLALNMALICVVNGPLGLTRVILSPMFNSPRLRIISMVLPNPLSSFISKTVASAAPRVSLSLSSRKRSARPTAIARRSWSPSPSLAEQGTIATD